MIAVTIVGVAMFLIGVALTVRVARRVSDFERDAMIISGMEGRLRSAEVGLRQMQHSGEVPILGGLEYDDPRINYVSDVARS